jgi:hypothetical protein
MKTITLKSVMTVLVALFSFNANAYDVYIDGIYYNLVSKTKTAEVTNKGGDGQNSYSGTVSIPAMIKKDDVTYSVSSIGNKAFYSCSKLTSVNIPEGVISIGEDAFWCCSRLTSVTIPEGVTSIEGGAFEGCSGLTSVTIPEGVTSISSTTFLGCRSLTSVTIPKGVTSIDGNAFSGCI